MEDRPWLLAGIAMATAFWLLSDTALGGTFLIALKGGSVAALAAYALSRIRTADARLLAAVMAVSAAGDAGMELDTVVGGALFLAAHLIAICLYLRNRRAHLGASQSAAALALILLVPPLAWLASQQLPAALYGLALGGMAAAAWTSRFSRYRVGVGALLFVASDLLIFARLGGRLDEALTGWFVWPLYYAGQLLITTGVIAALRRDHAA
ncbi:MAG: lysoplasmalogenase family protein [Tsuneonella sp.]